MSKFMPKKPVFINNNMLINGVPCISKDVFDAWFDKEIAPLFQNAVEVYAPDDLNGWMRSCPSAYTHKAILINIQPIKQDTPESLLRELIWRHESQLNDDRDIMDPLIEQAKKLLTGDK